MGRWLKYFWSFQFYIYRGIELLEVTLWVFRVKSLGKIKHCCISLYHMLVLLTEWWMWQYDGCASVMQSSILVWSVCCCKVCVLNCAYCEHFLCLFVVGWQNFCPWKKTLAPNSILTTLIHNPAKLSICINLCWYYDQIRLIKMTTFQMTNFWVILTHQHSKWIC